MHSTEFTRLARLADERAWEIVAMVENLPTPGTYPSAFVICKHEFARDADRPFLVTTGVLPDDGHEAFFITGSYDLTMPVAMELLAERTIEHLRLVA